MDKTELLEALEDSRQELLEMIDDLPDETLLKPGVVGDWSMKDILAHLTYWEGQVVTLLFQALQGVSKPNTAHFSKETVNQLNQRWHEAGKERSLEMVWQDWVNVRKQTIRRLVDFQDWDLNDPQHYGWLEGKPLYQWVMSDTIEHEEEHADQIGAWLEAQDTRSGNGKMA